MIKHNIFQIELKRLPFITQKFLDALTYKPFPVNWGIKHEGYYMMNVNNIKVNNFQGTSEVTSFNYLFQACVIKGYTLLMIKT